jgi:hypothetical protein
MNITIDVQCSDGEFDLWVSDDCGGSGISVGGQSVDETIENLKPYLEDYLNRAANGDNPFDWDNLKRKIDYLSGNKITFEDEGITLDSCFEDENVILYSIDSELYAETNKGKYYLPNIIEDEDDYYTIEDLVDEATYGE